MECRNQRKERAVTCQLLIELLVATMVVFQTPALRPTYGSHTQQVYTDKLALVKEEAQWQQEVWNGTRERDENFSFRLRVAFAGAVTQSI